MNSKYAKQFLARMREMAAVECQRLEVDDKMPVTGWRVYATAIADTELNRIMANVRGKA